jgi:hypothetical protein
MTDLITETPLVETEDSPLQAAVWMVKDLGVPMPPVPDAYLERLFEVSVGSVFATSDPLAAFHTRESLARAVALHGWPDSGLAFGFLNVGTGGRWFYVLVSEQQILQLSIRVSFYTARAEETGKAMIGEAIRLLEEHLSVEANAARALAASPSPVRRIATYSNELGLPVETRALWSAEDGISAFVPSFEVFAPESVLGIGEEAFIRI